MKHDHKGYNDLPWEKDAIDSSEELTKEFLKSSEWTGLTDASNKLNLSTSIIHYRLNSISVKFNSYQYIYETYQSVYQLSNRKKICRRYISLHGPRERREHT